MNNRSALANRYSFRLAAEKPVAYPTNASETGSHFPEIRSFDEGIMAAKTNFSELTAIGISTAFVATRTQPAMPERRSGSCRI